MIGICHRFRLKNQPKHTHDWFVVMFGITDLTAYLLAVVMIIILPGVNSLYCLSVSASHGKKAGTMAAAGIVFGDSILILATVLGAGTVLKLYPTVIKLLGGLYLAYLGIRLLMGVYQLHRSPHKSSNQPKQISRQNYFTKALTLSLTNPKAILFLLSFFVQFVDTNYPKPYLTFFILAIILQFISISYLGLLIVVGKTLADKFASRPIWSMIGMSLIGVLFLGFAVNMWASKLS